MGRWKESKLLLLTGHSLACDLSRLKRYFHIFHFVYGDTCVCIVSACPNLADSSGINPQTSLRELCSGNSQLYYAEARGDTSGDQGWQRLAFDSLVLWRLFILVSQQLAFCPIHLPQVIYRSAFQRIHHLRHILPWFLSGRPIFLWP